MPVIAFKDHFSGHAAAYAAARPRYPDELFAYLAQQCARHERAWDCATGNGQAALQLARYFARVVATDASAQQIAAAAPHERIEYRVAAADDSGLPGESLDLITVAQALHWFDLEQFFAEVQRVLRPGGVLAVWCYGTCQVTPAVDRLILDCYEALDPWWLPERRIVESGYSDIRLPLEQIDVPVFMMQLQWTATALLAYIETWSAVQRCRAETGREPVRAIAADLRAAWGQGTRTVSWPLYIKAGRND